MAFRCVIVTPEQQSLDESATQAIVPAWDGQIGILTGRAPLLVKLGMGPLRIDLQGGDRRTFFVAGGVAQMKDNRLTVLTDEAIPADDLDADAARVEYDQAAARVPNSPATREERTRLMQRARMKQEMASAR